MALNKKTFYTRTLSAVVFVAIMLTGLMWNEWSFLILICLINGLCLHEYLGLMKKITPDINRHVWQDITFQIISSLTLILSTKLGYLENPFSKLLSLPIFTVFIMTIPTILFLFSLLSKKETFFSTLQGISGMLYITLPLVFLAAMQGTDRCLPITLIALIWVNDTMAYLSGSLIGRTQLTPISPNKTWEGTISGVLLTIIAAIIYSRFSKDLSITDLIALALCASVMGTLGDLMKSKLKRMAGVKDSGNLIPGHGGVLDRFDSLLIATPFAFVYWAVFICKVIGH